MSESSSSQAERLQWEERCNYKESLLTETREELQKADSKASILLAASGIALSALATAFAAGTWSPSKLIDQSARSFAWSSIGSALLGLVLLGAAVKPRLRPSEMAKESLHYFGNVQAYWPRWFGRKRQEAMKRQRTEFGSALERAATRENHESRLDDQIWFLGHIAFRKYRFIIVGMWLFGLSLLLAVVALILEKY